MFLDISVRVTLRPKITKSAQKPYVSSKSAPKRTDKSAQANLALGNKGGVLGRQMLLTPVTLGLREVVH